MLKKIDESPSLGRLLQTISDGLARQRGLPVVLGIGLIITSLIVQSANVFAESNVLELIGVLAHHLGVLIAFIGLLLSPALGK